VWEASLQRSLSDYAAHHAEQLHSCVGRVVGNIVVCNKVNIQYAVNYLSISVSEAIYLYLSVDLFLGVN